MYNFDGRKLFLTILITWNMVGTQSTLPDYIKKCQYGDKTCMLKNINSLLNKKITGDKAFGLDSLDPLKLDKLSAKEEPNKPVSINIDFKNTKVYGGKFFEAAKISNFGKEPDGRHSVLLKGPYLTMISDYKVDGKVLILPVQGNGKSNLTLINPQIKLDLNGVSKNVNGKLYMDIKSVDADILCDRLYMKFENLFNGDKELGDGVNIFINENWREILNEMKKPIVMALNGRLYEIIREVFATTPYTDFFED